MKIFVHFQRFYSFDSWENLRCEPVPFLQTPFLFDTTGLVISLTNETQTKLKIFKSIRALFPVFFLFKQCMY
jgi:hypothetical protein